MSLELKTFSNLVGPVAFTPAIKKYSKSGAIIYNNLFLSESVSGFQEKKYVPSPSLDPCISGIPRNDYACEEGIGLRMKGLRCDFFFRFGEQEFVESKS